MKPCTVEFQAFGPYAGHELVDFEKLAARGLFLICGKTGTGKTMILDAITFALYGKSSGHGRDDFEAMRCTNAAFDVTTYVRFTFENNGIYYRFERRLERKRKNLSASYMVWQKDENGTWTALFENAKEKMLNEKAEEIIGLSYEQFRQVIVLPQGQFEKFLTSDSADKEKILTSIFGEEKWQAVAQLMFEEATERRQQLKSLQEQISNSLQEEACETLAELEAVIAHELSHIRNKDVRLMIVSIVFVGIFAMLAQMAMRSVYYSSMSRRRDEKNNTAIIIVLVMVVAAIGYFFSMLMRFAISRKREYLADAGAAEMTKNPLALASALRKISADPDIEAVKREDVAQLFIQHPGQQAKSALNGLSGLFATHPPIEKRIQVLEQF